MRFKGKTAVVTGGTSGIGKETAVRLVKEGAEVLFTGRDESRAEQALQELEKLGGRAYFQQQDVTKTEDWLRVAEQVEKTFGHLDVLVNSAGVFTYGAIEDTTYEEFKNVWRSNVDSVLLGMKHLLPSLEQASGVASVVNVSSLSGVMGHPDCVCYCTSKAGSLMLTRVMALEAAPKVRVNAVAPGPVWNELLERAHAGQNKEEMQEYYRESQPMKFLGDSSDVANGILYLASDAARYVTGTIFRIDAGRGAD